MTGDFKKVGKTIVETEAETYTLTNRQGAEAKVTNYGATIMTLKMPDKNGIFDDVV